MNTLKLIAACAITASLGTAFAHGNEGHSAPHNAHAAHGASPGAAGAAGAAPEQTPYGIAGKASAVQRTITLQMDDAMRFTPSHITVAQGQTVRLKVHNQGQAMHEIVLGTPGSLAEHQKMMQEHPDMAHDAPSMAHVAPGKNGEVIWTFNRPGSFDFACLVAGHFEAGMKGTITVTP